MATFKWNPRGLATLQELINLQTGKVAVNDLFNVAFMTDHTTGRFADLDSMIAASGAPISKLDDLQSNAVWEEFVRQNTKFPSWTDMFRAAHQSWANRRQES